MAPPPPSLLSPRRQTPRPGTRVLVVDDDPLATTQIARTIEQLGYTAVTANSWTDALRRFQERPADLILMDAVMPGVDGFKLMGLLRERSRSYIPILFLTSLQDPAARERGVSLGADDFLTKPVDPFELRVRMAALLRIRHLTQALEDKTRQLSELAKTDGLTQLANRRSFDEQLHAEFDRARRYGRPLTLLMMDVDHFKLVNDTHGHDVGDEVLRYLGRVLEENVRACDLTFRFGGEEFSVLAPETAAPDAWHVAERLRQGFELGTAEATKAGVQTLSVGLADTLALALDADAVARDLIRAADDALYAAKRGGRNRVCCVGMGDAPPIPANARGPNLEVG